MSLARFSMKRGSIIILALFAALPMRGYASCAVPNEPPYVDVSEIAYGNEGMYSWDLLDANLPVPHGRGYLTVVSTRRDVMMMGPLGGRLWGWSATPDPPSLVFDRLLTVLTQYKFFLLPDPVKRARTWDSSTYSIMTVRCGVRRVLQLVIPKGEHPSSETDGTVLRLFEDLIRATYRSKWHATTITYQRSRGRIALRA
jgi:hypothetical protein